MANLKPISCSNFFFLKAISVKTLMHEQKYSEILQNWWKNKTKTDEHLSYHFSLIWWSLIADKDSHFRFGYLSGPAQLQLHEGHWSAVRLAPPAGSSLKVHPPGETSEARLPAALGHQALPHTSSLTPPEAREGSGLFRAHAAAAALPPGLGRQKGLQLGVIHVCCGDGLWEGENHSRDEFCFG